MNAGSSFLVAPIDPSSTKATSPMRLASSFFNAVKTQGLRHALERVARHIKGGKPTNYASFAFPPDGDVKGNIRSQYDFEGDLVDIFTGNQGESVFKWHHYIPVYDRYLSRYRGSAVKFLELGVYRGGSLRMWREYFGQKAIIYGIDIDPACRRFDGRAGQVRIGSQDDERFLQNVVDEMGGVDVVLDDGSHVMQHIRKSLVTLYPLLTDNGIYMIEDLHTAYSIDHGGGYGGRDNFFNLVRQLTDDMHRWYHSSQVRHPGVGDALLAIHVYDSMVILEKSLRHRPVHSMIP